MRRGNIGFVDVEKQSEKMRIIMKEKKRDC